jgi:tRNA (mo5U34)-methyltransferase
MRKASLRAVASEFHQRLKTLKNQTRLKGVEWYPWDSLAAFDVVDGFLKGDIGELRRIAGHDPVLDVGCGDGDVAFFLESLGMKVDTIDHAPTNYNALVGVRTLKKLLNSNVGIHPVDLDHRPNLPGSHYGLAIMLGVLYHLKNPFLVLETLARHSRHILLSTRVASLTPDRKLNYGALPMAYLVDEDELNHDPTNFWIFSEEGLKRIVRRSGWNILSYTTSGPPASSADPVSPAGDVRAYILAESRLADLTTDFRLERGWHHLEHNVWRWTESRFSTLVDIPDTLTATVLKFRFHLAPETLDQRPAVTLTARLNGEPLPPITFSTGGEQEYAARVATATGRVQVEFEVDPPIRSTEGDTRELGVLVDFSAGAPILLE